MPRLNQLFNRAGLTNEVRHPARHGPADEQDRTDRGFRLRPTYTGRLKPRSALTMFQRLREDIALHPRTRPCRPLGLGGADLLPGPARAVVAPPGQLVLDPWLSLAGPFHLALQPLADRHRDPPGRQIGRKVFIDHGMGIVIGEMAEIGEGCTIYQGVTLGGTSLVKGCQAPPDAGPGVIVGANACVLGGFTVGAGARIGSGAVVTKPVPAGARPWATGARIIEAQSDQAREEAAARMGFSAYGITQGDDPVVMAMRGLIDSAASQDHQIAMLAGPVQAVHPARQAGGRLCVPVDAQRDETFDAASISKLVG